MAGRTGAITTDQSMVPLDLGGRHLADGAVQSPVAVPVQRH
jgi:hypothetical protein